jgi:hypothetical protein
MKVQMSEHGDLSVDEGLGKAMGTPAGMPPVKTATAKSARPEPNVVPGTVTAAEGPIDPLRSDSKGRQA